MLKMCKNPQKGEPIEALIFCKDEIRALKDLNDNDKFFMLKSNNGGEIVIMDKT